jgi:putative colanic acid biosynthesis acetyltransferase WcaF
MSQNFDLLANKQGFVGSTFTLSNRLKRLLWQIVWAVFASWTPPFLHFWRILLLRIFGASVSWRAYVYPDVKIWAPWNLTIEDYGTLGRGVVCYNIAHISIGERAVISQRVHLCTGTHNYLDPAFPLTAKPIKVERRAWVCANSFVGPGVTVGDGAILAAAGMAHRSLEPWSIYSGNPAKFLRPRPVIDD